MKNAVRFRITMKQKPGNLFPKCWDEARVKRLLDCCERIDHNVDFWQAPAKIVERWIAESGLEIISGLRSKRLSIEDAEEDLFNLDLYQWAVKRRLSREILEIFEWGMQLEDVVEIAPDSIETSLSAIEKHARGVLDTMKIGGR